MSGEGLSNFKETIIEKARKGAFNNNPLLNTTHIVTCRECKHRQGIVFLEYLKSGEFEFGKVEQVEVFDIQGPMGFLEMENVTPIIIGLICEKCGCRIEARPISTEYLKIIIDTQKTVGIMYV